MRVNDALKHLRLLWLAIRRRPRSFAAAARLGELAGAAGGRVIYGGGHVGLMGAVADAAMAAGGEVMGLIPTRLLEREVGHRAITELVVTATCSSASSR